MRPTGKLPCSFIHINLIIFSGIQKKSLILFKQDKEPGKICLFPIFAVSTTPQKVENRALSLQNQQKYMFFSEH